MKGKNPIYDIAPLFAPMQVGNKIFRNRIVLPPMVVSRGIDTPEAREWYARRARGGVALVIVEATDSLLRGKPDRRGAQAAGGGDSPGGRSGGHPAFSGHPHPSGFSGGPVRGGYRKADSPLPEGG
ncbi:MAG: hypothetical protein IT210_06555 [Armatimonadetes bacterium]|nr:hypothetical protein [Armatimonadota bacterium]